MSRVRSSLSCTNASQAKFADSGTVHGRVNAFLNKVKSWSNLNGSKALFNWFTETAEKKLFYVPLVYGNVGSFEFSEASLSTLPQITSHTSGIAYDVADMYIKRINFAVSTIWEQGNADMTSKPSNMNSGMWYMYAEQANAGRNYNTALGNIGRVIDAINDTYDQKTHNKFYMTYVGGCGATGLGNTNVSGVTSGFNSEWSNKISTLKGKPYGWVLFNYVASDEVSRANIEKVISNNNDVNFKLARDKSAPINTKAPSGDTQGVRRVALSSDNDSIFNKYPGIGEAETPHQSLRFITSDLCLEKLIDYSEF